MKPGEEWEVSQGEMSISWEPGFVTIRGHRKPFKQPYLNVRLSEEDYAHLLELLPMSAAYFAMYRATGTIKATTP